MAPNDMLLLGSWADRLIDTGDVRRLAGRRPLTCGCGAPVVVTDDPTVIELYRRIHADCQQRSAA